MAKTIAKQTYADTFLVRMGEIDAVVAPFVKCNVALASNIRRSQLQAVARQWKPKLVLVSGLGDTVDFYALTFPDQSSCRPEAALLPVLRKILN